jgi:protein-tyrosine sulfotransferase
MSLLNFGGKWKPGQLWDALVRKYFLMGPSTDLKKYIEYVFDTQSFTPIFDEGGISDHALQTARIVRGEERAPALIIHGIMPRSGTVYVGDLLRLHPDLYAYPRHLFEVPFLQVSEDILGVQDRFFLGHRHNIGKLGERDFLPLFASSFIAYLYSSVPEGQRMLLKVPGVRYLSRFYSAFPYENLLVLVRDGRDVVQSTVKTWPQLRFSFVCRRWKRSAEMVLECHKHYSAKPRGYWLARFEDVVRDPAAFVREACEQFDLDESRYPFEKIRQIPIRGSSSTPKQGKVVWDAVDKPKGFDPVGRWQRWSAAKRRTLKRIAGQALLDLGYCENLDW